MKILEKCANCGRQIPYVCFCGNLALALFKVTVGFISGSKGLVADGFHSGSDVLATVMVIISLKISDRDENKAHPWGYGKAEYIGSLFVYSVLFFLGSYIFIDAAKNIIMGNTKPPHMISCFAALVSILGNLILSSYGFCAGKRLNSPAMIANANENKADMLSSVAVVLGIMGSRAGLAFADPLAAIAVGVLIVRMSLKLIIEALTGLMDKSIDAEGLQRIKYIALAHKGVEGVSFVRGRKSGGKTWIEMELIVGPGNNVTQANSICAEVRTSVMRKAVHIKDINVTFTCHERMKYATGRYRSLRKRFMGKLKRRSVKVYSEATE